MTEDHEARAVAGGDWDQLSEWWQDTFTAGADEEYERQIIPLALEHLSGAARVLDLGCGEGQIARPAVAAGAVVVGVEASIQQLATATDRGGGPAYAQGSGGALPARDGSFDAVLLSLVLEHIDDLEATLAEVARVLRSGGRLVLVLNHPLLQSPGSGWVDDHLVDPPAQYWQVGPYLQETSFAERMDAGQFVTFIHRPLSTYVNTLAAVGLYVTKMVEPPPVTTSQDAAIGPAVADIPRMMLIRADKIGA